MIAREKTKELDPFTHIGRDEAKKKKKKKNAWDAARSTMGIMLVHAAAAAAAATPALTPPCISAVSAIKSAGDDRHEAEDQVGGKYLPW